MDSDWQEVRRQISIAKAKNHLSSASYAFKDLVQQIQLPLTQDNQFGPIPNIATIAFDTQQELLWVGDIHGRVTSYRWPIERQLLRYTALEAHTEDEGPVQQFLFNEKGVISVAAKSVHFMIRRALTQWHLEDKDMTNLSCMSFLGKDGSHQILVGGCQKVMFKIDVDDGSIAERIPTHSDYIMMKHSRLYICAATNTGSIDFLHPVNLQVVKSWSAHSSKISSMDAKNDFLVTCGWSTRPHGNPSLDTIAKVYDLKKLEQAAPISFPAGAAFVQIHPKLSTTTVVASQNGQIHVADIHNTDHVKVLHMTLAHFMSLMIMSPSGKVWAIADQDNTIHLWGSPHDLQFCDISKPPELADSTMASLHMAVDADVPLSTIGMPYYYENLFSNWGYDRELRVQKSPAAIDPDIFKQLRLDPTGSGRAQWVTNPRKMRRNQVELNEPHVVNGSSSSKNRISDTANKLANVALSTTKELVPQLYQYARMNYDHKHGVKGFDFEYYNKTTYSGLENDIINCYMNPLIQVLRFTVFVRNLALHHVSGSCLSEGCLLCELGFLFDMLEKAGGTACRAMNFLKVFSSRPEAVKLGILEESSPRNKLDARLSTANRFILEQICNDFRRVRPYDFSLDQTLKTNGLQGYQCLNCGSRTNRNEPFFVINLIYPDSNQNQFTRHRNHVAKFSETLGLGFQGEQRSRGWCQGCKKYASMESQRTVVRVSDVLVINAGLEKSPKGRQLWANPGWVPQEIGVTVEGNQLMCHEGQQLQPFRNYRSTTIYELVGLVAEISGTDTQSSHLVSFIDVAGSQPGTQTESQWHLFNDFVVAPVDQREALDFAPSWKTPVVLIYQVSHARHSIDDSWKKAIDIGPLYYDGSMNRLRNPHTLTPNEEYILEGTHVAIDAEFVVLQRKEISISYSQTEHIIRPPRSAIGRLSVLRGDSGGPKSGLPFIDDYIIVADPIIDYVTQYSGLSEGDLNPTTSRHAPIHLKVAYKKLWLLLNLGAIFIGHGLYNDFRNCNIHVPETQYKDTSILFRKGEYTLRLSFLANHFLKEDIQVGNHDSIEDARSALLLYRKALEFMKKGTMEREVDAAHEEWRKRLAFQRLEEPMMRREVGGGGEGAGGRMTPEVGGRRAAGSRPETPVRRGRVGGEGSGVFESPLRGGGE